MPAAGLLSTVSDSNSFYASARMRTAPHQLGPASPADHVRGWTQDVLDGYMATRHRWNPASSLTALLRQMQREYADRFLYELVQNAYDAHPADAEGEILILLDLDEGEHGVLYVANGGAPFTPANFEAMCSLAQSDKPPDQAIGNKGVGFKSVLQVAAWPEIYSRSSPTSDSFDGFCFGFATPEAVLSLVNGDNEMARAICRDVAPYFLAVPIETTPPAVEELARRKELVTVIRLPLDGKSALETTVERLAKLTSDSVPLQLFLPRLRQLDIVTRTGGEDEVVRLERDAMPVGEADRKGGARFEIVDLGIQGEWFVAHRRIDGAQMRAAIDASALDEAWSGWREETEVSVAVRRDGSEIEPRLYTFLPMDRTAAAPLHGHLHAPFVTQVARTALNENLALNRMLLDEAARAATTAVLTFARVPDALPPPAVVDMLAWDQRHHERVTASFDEADVDMTTAEVVPIRPLRNGRDRAAFENTYVWRHECSVLTADALAIDAQAEIVDSALGRARIDRLERYCKAFFHTGFDLDHRDAADWVEQIAQALLNNDSDPRAWEAFYDDLATVFTGAAEALAARRVLLGDDGELHPVPSDEGETDQPLVFFPAALESSDDDEEVEGEFELRPPERLRQRLIVLNGELAWNRQDGRTRRATPARHFLERNRLVRRFRRSDLFDHIGHALAGNPSAGLCSDALAYAFRLYTSARSVDPADLRAADLRVPCRDGRWRPASEALFSHEWETPLSMTLDELVSRSQGVSSELRVLGDRQLSSPSRRPFEPNLVEAWRRFLFAIGVRDGLPLTLLQRSTAPRPGSQLHPDRIARELGLDVALAEQWSLDVRSHTDWQARHPYTDYTPATPFGTIPGAADYRSLDSRARSAWARLVVAGLGKWGPNILTIEWARRAARHRGSPDRTVWPSPISTVLRQAEWLPTTTPGDRRAERFAAASEAWFFADKDRDRAPNFSTLVAPSLRRQLSDSPNALNALKRLDLGDWTDEDHAPRLLQHLARILETGELPSTALLAFRGAVQDAWDRAASAWAPEEFADAMGDSSIVVSFGDRLAAIRPRCAPDTLHVVGDQRSFAARVLHAAKAPMIHTSSARGVETSLLLGPLVGRPVPTSDRAEVDVVVDGERYAASTSEPRLLDGHLAWLRDVVHLVLELRRSRFDMSSPRRRTEILATLDTVRIRHVSTLTVQVGGVALPADEVLGGVAPIDDPVAPTLVTTLSPSSHSLPDLLPGLCEILRIPDYEDAIGRAVDHVQRAGREEPTQSDLAEAVRVDVARVCEVLSHVDARLRRLVELAAPAIACEHGAETGRTLLAAQNEIADEASLLERFAAIIGDEDNAKRLIAVVRDCGSHLDVCTAMGLDYARFNTALLNLDLEPMHNEQGHAQALEHFVEAHRDLLLLRLRRRFLDAYQKGEALDSYVDARRLDIAETPRDWLQIYDIPPDRVLERHLEQWVDRLGVDPSNAQLEPIGPLRSANRQTVLVTTAAASQVVLAWTRKNGVALAPFWEGEQPAASFAEREIESGRLDFERLDEAAVLDSLASAALWPEGMPRTLDVDELGLDKGDLASAATAEQASEREREQRRRRIEFGGHEYSARKDDYEELIEHVRTQIRPELLRTANRTKRLVELAADVRQADRTRRNGSGRRAVTGPRLSREQTETIGRIGETVAYEWLREKYGDLCTPRAWRSANCDVIGQPSGDDSLGYDFEIIQKSRTVFFEVKATRGTDPTFELGESEVVRARDCARSSRYEYRVLFITEVLEPNRQQLHVLPNPMDPTHSRLFRFPGSGLTCTFRIDD